MTSDSRNTSGHLLDVRDVVGKVTVVVGTWICSERHGNMPVDVDSVADKIIQLHQIQGVSRRQDNLLGRSGSRSMCVIITYMWKTTFPTRGTTINGRSRKEISEIIQEHHVSHGSLSPIMCGHDTRNENISSVVRNHVVVWDRCFPSGLVWDNICRSIGLSNIRSRDSGRVISCVHYLIVPGNT
ncbi:hypothetical protein [Salmon gill poxvirus]|nr:hypothetical protein [Salmon gill poxvirus]